MTAPGRPVRSLRKPLLWTVGTLGRITGGLSVRSVRPLRGTGLARGRRHGRMTSHIDKRS
ncbi:hypothetical protein F4561_004615 [Lipingzhangella halophila]|uniref:Uncharacterized protein n=1 Tax=Lipingzhangella halophila TaxID=1783352 RepID=A0A7W7W5H8_9ACTN|nr:hypothetical protein [Lipingzhangella halophila]